MHLFSDTCFLRYGNRPPTSVTSITDMGDAVEGASVSTVPLELSAIRGLFQLALDIGAVDVMSNPARNVKVRKTR